MTYHAIIGKIKTYPHPNADRIQLGSVCGNQVVVGLETKDGDLMVYFDADGQLSEAFAKGNDLVGYTDPKTGTKKGGYFAANRRVRAQKFRGERSDGFACPVSYLKATEGLTKKGHKIIEALKDGDQFNTIDGAEICTKYITRATRSARLGQQKSKSRKKNPRFPQHFDTKQFRYEASKIPKGSIITLTEKLHGSSGRYGFVQEEVSTKVPWYKRIFGIKPKPRLEYRRVAGTRRVILDGEDHDGFHGKAEFRYDFMRDVWSHMRKGELIYGEIVGFVGTETPIMPKVSTKPLKDKAFHKRWGDTMTYKYGCPVGEHRFYVYRIAMTNEDGYVVDLPWPMVKRRCAELGLQHVPDLVDDGELSWVHDDAALNQDEVLPALGVLEDTVRDYVDGPSLLDDSHIREGVAIRVDAPGGMYVLKEKSFPFKVLEGIAKDDSDYIDMEEQEDVE